MVDFSVIIPTYNRPGVLSVCLEHLEKLDYPADRFEVLVVDDGSDCSYTHVQRAFARVHWLRQENAGPAAARNFGARQAAGRYLAFTDDDCRPDPGWLSRLAEGLAADPGALVGGSTVAIAGAHLYDQVAPFITTLVYRHFNADSEDARFFSSNNMSLEAGLFRRAGGFAVAHTQNAAEDRTFCTQIRSLGHPLRWQREAVTYHDRGLDLRRFCEMYFRYGRGAYTYQRVRAAGTLAGDATFHLRLPASLWRELRAHPDLARGPTLLLVGLWQVCYAAGFLFQSANRRPF